LNEPESKEKSFPALYKKIQIQWEKNGIFWFVCPNGKEKSAPKQILQTKAKNEGITKSK